MARLASGHLESQMVYESFLLQCVLSSIIMVALKGMILQVNDCFRYAKVSLVEAVSSSAQKEEPALFTQTFRLNSTLDFRSESDDEETRVDRSEFNLETSCPFRSFG